MLLAIYDWWVLGFMAQVVLRSPTSLLVDRYRPLFGERHLDIGPGTGYFIDVAAPSGMELTLLDPNRRRARPLCETALEVLPDPCRSRRSETPPRSAVRSTRSP